MYSEVATPQWSCDVGARCSVPLFTVDASEYLRKLICLKDHTSDLLGTVAVVLVVLWVLGMVSSYTVGGFIHVLLVIAIVVLIRALQGRKPV